MLTNATSSILPGSAAFEADPLSKSVTIAQPRSALIFLSPRTTSSGNVSATNWLGRSNFGGRPRLADELALIAKEEHFITRVPVTTTVGYLELFHAAGDGIARGLGETTMQRIVNHSRGYSHLT